MAVYTFLNKYNFCKQIPIFKNLNWFELQKVARKAIIEEHKKSEVFCKEGDPPDYFYCLISGRLLAYTGRDGTGRKDVDFIHRGMHFGVISVLTGENHSLNYQTINDSIILKISVEDFREILKSIPHLGIELSQVLSQRLRSQVRGTKTVFESRIISVYSPVQGTGSSTYTINLALSIQKETKKKVIYVNVHSPNVDKLGDEPASVDATPRWKTPAVNLIDIVGDHNQIVGSIIKDDLPVDLISVSINPEDSSVTSQISPFVSALVGDYHYVVVDLPNEMDEVVFGTLTQSDLVHLIVSDKKKDLEVIRTVIDRMQLSLKENFRTERLKVIIRAAHHKVYLSFEEINNFIEYDIHGVLPYLDLEQLKETIDSRHLSFKRPDAESEYAKNITRLAREIGGVLVGVVLGGGAALGIAHIGVIKVLEEEGIPVDVVVGSSMGALIGALWTVGRDWKELHAIAAEFRTKKGMLKLVHPFDLLLPKSGILAGYGIVRWLKGHLGSRTFYSVKIPFKTVTYDLKRREEYVVDSGSLVDAVRQSIAIPGVIKPVCEDDKVLIDGGVLNPLPTNVLASRGIKKIIAVNVLQSPDDVSEGFDLELHRQKASLSVPFREAPWKYISERAGNFFIKILNPNIPDIIVQTLQASEYVIAESSGQQADVLIHPDLVGIGWYELDKYEELIAAGEKATRELLPKIKKLIEE